MKKLILILVSVLIVVYILLSVFSSGKEYAAEKLFYRANRIYDKIKANPDVVPPGMVKSAENYFYKIIGKYYYTKTARLAYITLAELYATDKNYGNAIKTLDKFISTYDDTYLLSRAYFLKALVYEKQNQWDKALKELTTLKNKYSKTPLGLQAPLYIAQHYARKDRTADAESAYSSAIEFYEGLRKEGKGTLLGYASSDLLIQCYMGLKRYEEAGSVVETTIKDYTANMLIAPQLSYVELIFVTILNKPEKAVEIYKYIAEKTGNKRLKKLLEKRIKALQNKR